MEELALISNYDVNNITLIINQRLYILDTHVHK